jgi:S-adenosyl-methyltransferase MraW
MMSDNIIQDKPIHIPVLKDEVISLLDIQPDGIYIDGTCGLGGHSKLILKNLSPKGTLIGIDVDQAALDLCEASVNKSYKNFHIKKNSYSNLPAILKKKGIDRVSGILLDLGLSSLQLDSLDRGFSYKNNCQLDMRFDQSTPIKAADLINKSTQSELADIIYHYGEERRSRLIAKKINQSLPISNVQDLVEIIRNCTPPQKRNKTLARVFQA